VYETDGAPMILMAMTVLKVALFVGFLMLFILLDTLNFRPLYSSSVSKRP
jgi:hypothetical protein